MILPKPTGKLLADKTIGFKRDIILKKRHRGIVMSLEILKSEDTPVVSITIRNFPQSNAVFE